MAVMLSFKRVFVSQPFKTIGVTPSTVSLLADYLLRFSRKYPHIHFDVHEGSTFALKDQLESGEHVFPVAVRQNQRLLGKFCKRKGFTPGKKRVRRECHGGDALF